MKANTASEELEDGTGIAWSGQTNAVERFVLGIDDMVIKNLASQIDGQLKALYDAVLDQVIVQIEGDSRFEGFELEIDTDQIELPQLEWSQGSVIPQTSYLSEQSAVDLAALLVNIQSGYARYVEGVATVGGRTRVGVITRGEGFRMINEPELRHDNVGFGE